LKKMIEFDNYTRKVFYYETDKMGIVHHSNYIRMFEETRIYLLEKAGLDFAGIESLGYLSPVLSVNCEYKYSLKFGDEFYVKVKLSEFGNVRYGFSYEIIRSDGQLCATGNSTHCFTDTDGKVVSLKRVNRDLYDRFMSLKEEMADA